MTNKKSPIQELERQRKLLLCEYNAEKEKFKRQTETMGMARKVKRGDCWYGIHIGRNYYNSLNQPVVEVFRDDDTEIDHNFEYGRHVMFFCIGSNDEIRYLKFSATVSYAEQNRMVLVVPDMVCVGELRSHDNLGVQLSFDETTYQLMLGALNRVMAAKDCRLAELRDIFYSPKACPRRLKSAPMVFPWLNSAQEKAVNEVLCARDVAVVHGPPGTGKTTTLVEAIFETLRRENQVMVCAQSNMAVDWISERLVDRGVDVLRIGNPTKVNEKMLSFTYEKKFENHPDYPQLWAARKALRDMRSRKKKGDLAFYAKLDKLKERVTALEFKINSELFACARVVACTLAGSAARVLDGMKFSTLFIDEAAQALEAACWIPAAKVDRIIFAGDHCQLPPTVKSVEALRGGLGKTLMERIVENIPQAVTLLNVQYRMNEDIMRFSSNWFYGGVVQSAPDVRHRGILDYDVPIAWIDTADVDGHEQFVGESFGRINKAEAQLTMQTLQDYFNKIGCKRVIEERIDVGIISPYRAQVQYLRRLLRGSEFFRPFSKCLTVNTVDGFQGQERDIVLISLVRSNDSGQIGFLRDLRRMNVAMTRARMKLIILGDVATMTAHPFYKRLHDYVESLNLDAALPLDCGLEQVEQ